jgi:excisionase family DNA binding protein
MLSAPFITVPQLAQRWAISLAHAYRVVERHELPSMRIGHSIRIPLQAVEEHERRASVA